MALFVRRIMVSPGGLMTKKQFESLSIEKRRDYFIDLFNKWIRNTLALSSIQQICDYKVFDELCEFGEALVPFLFEDLKQRATIHAILLLSQVTGVNPIPECARGYLDECAQLWLDWGKENYGI